MNKKLTGIIFFVFLYSVLEQRVLFCSSRIVQPKLSAFTTRFVEIARHHPSLLKAVQIFSQSPLEYPIENQLLRLKCEDGVKISVGITQFVADKQKELLKEMKRDEVSVVCLPEEYNYLDWQEIVDENELLRGVKFVQNYEYDSVLQAAFFSYWTDKRAALLGKNKEVVIISESPSTYAVLDELQEKFKAMLQHHKK